MGDYVPIGRIRPVYKGAWSANEAYTVLDMVRSTDGYTAYVALQDVPAGTPLTSADHWAAIVDMAGAISNVLNTLDGYAASFFKQFKAYDTAAAMRADAALKPGMYALTCGYYDRGDGGGALYAIAGEASADKWCETTANGYAELTAAGSVPAECFGMRAADDFDCAEILLKLCAGCDYRILFGEGTYRFSECFFGKGSRVDLHGVSADSHGAVTDAAMFLRRTIFAPYAAGQRYVMKLGGKADYSVDSESDYTVNQLSGASITGVTFTEDKLLAEGSLPYTALLAIDNCVNGHFAAAFYYTRHTSLLIRESWEIHFDSLSVRGSYTNVNTPAILLADRAITSSASNISNLTIDVLDGEQIAGQLIASASGANVSNSRIGAIILENGRQVSELEESGGALVAALTTSSDDTFGAYAMNPIVQLENMTIGSIDLSLIGRGYYLNGEIPTVDGVDVTDCAVGTVRTDLSVLYCNGGGFELLGNPQSVNASAGYLNSIAVIGSAYAIRGDGVIVNPRKARLCPANLMGMFKLYRSFSDLERSADGAAVYSYYNGTASTIVNRGGFTCSLYARKNADLELALTLAFASDYSGAPFTVLLTSGETVTELDAPTASFTAGEPVRAAAVIPAGTQYDSFAIRLNDKCRVYAADASTRVDVVSTGEGNAVTSVARIGDSIAVERNAYGIVRRTGRSVREEGCAEGMGICVTAELSGATALTVTHCGKNMLDPAKLVLKDPYFNSNGSTGTSSSVGVAYVPVDPDKTYAISAVGSGYVRISEVDKDKAFIKRFSLLAAAAEGASLTLVPTSADTAYFQIGADTAAGSIQLEIGSKATDYEPYSGEAYAMTFPAAVTGALNLSTGEVAADGQTVQRVQPRAIRAHAGNNTVYADTGALTVDFNRDVSPTELILISPGGAAYRLTVDDSGTLTATEITD